MKTSHRAANQRGITMMARIEVTKALRPGGADYLRRSLRLYSNTSSARAEAVFREQRRAQPNFFLAWIAREIPTKRDAGRGPICKAFVERVWLARALDVLDGQNRRFTLDDRCRLYPRIRSWNCQLINPWLPHWCACHVYVDRANRWLLQGQPNRGCK